MEKSKSLKRYELIFYSILVAMGVVILGSIMSGCSGVQIKNPVDMTNQERAAFALTLYNNAFANYNTQFAAAPKPMSVEMKDYFQGYKKVMENAWPVISAFTAVVQVGTNPTPDQEQQIIQIIYQLQTILLSKIQ